MEPHRPDPDLLLARVARQEQKQVRGRLKIFFGACAGVGKTFAMLQAGRLRNTAGVDVVAGYVETHRRPETAALLDGLELLPRRKVAYRGSALEEFDLDAGLARRPSLILVDELAHTNAPGSRHAKRWQDVLELLDAGIDVYTTVNVQHLDSLNDLVTQVTGVAVRETVPDSVFDQADDIALIDLPPNELQRRLEEGKVYIPEQAERAIRSFFRTGNLIALREMALRRTADRVDAQMLEYREDHAVPGTWPVAERLMVCIGPSPNSARLIRAAGRMASLLNAEWIAAHVETPDYARESREVKDRVLASLRSAEQLGAEAVTLTGPSVSEAALRYARSRNVSKIVTGKPAGPLWKRALRRSIVDKLVEGSGEIDIYAISGEPSPPESVRAPKERLSIAWREYAIAALVVLACTLVSLPLRSHLTAANLVMFYLLGVVAVSMRCGRGASTFTSFLSVAAFDFFCVPPYYTFAFSDYEYAVTFAVMLTVALVISNLTVRIRMQATGAVDREARTHALYRLSRRLSGQTRIFEAARVAAELTSDVFKAQAVIFLPDSNGKISFKRRTSDRLPVPSSEEGIAQWVYDHAQKAGRGTDTLPGATAVYLPLKGSQQVLGVLAAIPDEPEQFFATEQQHLLEVFASQTAAALERAETAAAAREAALQIETEQMRNSLLSAVSHDLRTPLASITGAATSLLEKGDRLDPKTSRDLLESIADEAERLSRLVNNLLEMTRLESGAVQVRREWHPLEEIIGAALTRLDRTLGRRRVITDIPVDLPLVLVDDVLLEQVFMNLLENAIKYTPPESPIEIVASAAGDKVNMEVRDRGPGFAPTEDKLAFEKFYRGKSQGSRGAGLGLSICRAIIAAHQGEISAANRPDGGAVIRVRLPVGGEPPKIRAGMEDSGLA